MDIINLNLPIVIIGYKIMPQLGLYAFSTGSKKSLQKS